MHDHVVSFNFLSFLSGQTERVSLKHLCIEISNSHQSWINNTSEHTSHVRVCVQKITKCNNRTVDVWKKGLEFYGFLVLQYS